jgi:hypothetical protein
MLIFLTGLLSYLFCILVFKELDGRCAIKDAKQCSEIFWYYLYIVKRSIILARMSFRRHVKPLAPAVFAVSSTHQSALGLRGGLWAVLLMCA